MGEGPKLICPLDGGELKEISGYGIDRSLKCYGCGTPYSNTLFQEKIDQEISEHIDEWGKDLKAFKKEAPGVVWSWANGYEDVDTLFGKLRELDKKRKDLSNKLDLAKKAGLLGDLN